MDDVKEYRRLALIMVVGFVATVGVLYGRDHSIHSESAPSPLATAPPTASLPALAAVHAPSAFIAPTAQIPVARPAQPDAAAKVTEDASTPAPAALHVFVNRMRETDRRRVRLANTGAEPIECLVRVWRDGTVIGERQLELRFNSEATLGVDDGLEVHPGDRIVVQSNLGPQLADVAVS